MRNLAIDPIVHGSTLLHKCHAIAGGYELSLKESTAALEVELKADRTDSSTLNGLRNFAHEVSRTPSSAEPPLRSCPSF
jgi:hypothetical protein